MTSGVVPGANPLAYEGVKAQNPPNVITSIRAPTSADINYDVGTIWIDYLAGASYFLVRNAVGVATWNLNGAGGSGGIVSITGDAGGAEVPDGGGNFNVLGTTDQIETTGSTNTQTLSLSATLVAPGSITSTTSIDAGTTLTSAGATTLATTGASVNTFGNATGATSVTITSGTGGIALTGTNGAVTVVSGTGAINVSADATATTINVGTGAGAKALTLGSTNTTSASTLQGGSGGVTITGTNGAVTVASGTGGMNISADAAATTVNVGTGAAAKTLTVGSTNTTSTTTVQAGSGGISLAAAGLVAVTTATDTQASPTAASTLNVRAGAATFTGFTTASAASQNFTITNSLVTTSSNILCTVCNEGGNDAQMTIQRITRGSGSFVVTCKNNGAAALNGNVIVTFWVLKN